MASKYILRLDDAAAKRDVLKWEKIEKLLDSYEVKPLVGIIPDCADPDMERFKEDHRFWELVKQWEDKGWTIALHGFKHVFNTQDGGINPVNQRSEFAGLSYEKQAEMIRSSMHIFKVHNVEPSVFFAPAHTFDLNTIKAIKNETEIRFISDTVANSPYLNYGIVFVPQQSGKARRLPFSVCTFCYHPNNMQKQDFDELEDFIANNKRKFASFPLMETTRKLTVYDFLLRKLYYLRIRTVRRGLE